jgi:hypothetical protein
MAQRARRAGRQPTHRIGRFERVFAALAISVLTSGLALVGTAVPAPAQTDPTTPTTTTPSPTAAPTSPPTTTPATTPATAAPTTPTTSAPAPTAAPTTAPTTTPTTRPVTTTAPRESHSDPEVQPVLVCSYLDKATKTYTSVWGYNNKQSSTADVGIGSKNKFSNPSSNVGQPTSFEPGTHTNVFDMTHKGKTTWKLTKYNASAPVKGKTCESPPVPMISAGWASLITLALITVVGGLVLFWRSRRSRRA